MRISAALAALLVVGSAQAHDHWADGSAVPKWVKDACCGEGYAHHVDLSDVHRADDGAYRVFVDGVPLSVPQAKATPSQDGDYWIFYAPVAPGVIPTPICFFVPMGA